MIGEKYPSTRLYDLNLDWLYDKIKEIENAGGDVAEELQKIIDGEIAVKRAEQSANGSNLDTAASQAADADAGVMAIVNGSQVVPNASHAVSADSATNATNATNARNAVSGSQLATAVTNAENAYSGVTAFADGSATVKKSEQDANGDIIATTYVKKTNRATNTSYGIVRFQNNMGITISDGDASISTPSEAAIQTRNTTALQNSHLALVLNKIDYAVVQSLTGNSLTLTTGQKTNVKTWLGIPDDAPAVDSQGTTQSIKIKNGTIEIRGAGITNQYVLIDSSGFTLVDETDPESPQPITFKTWTTFFS